MLGVRRAILKREAIVNLILGGILCAAVTAPCAEKKDDIEYGPFISATILSQWPKDWPREGAKEKPRGSYTYKAIAVRLGLKEGPQEAGIVFDTDLLRVSSGWDGGFLKLQGIPYDMQHGMNPELAGTQRFGTRRGPGWAKGGVFEDPRPVAYGPLPNDWAKYKGLYRNGSKIVFAYSVGSSEVLESHSFEGGVFYREFTLGASTEPREVMLFETESGNGAAYPATQTAAIEEPGSITAARLFGGVAGMEFNFPKASAISLKIPASAQPLNFKVGIFSGKQKEFDAFTQLPAGAPAADLMRFCAGGPAQWTAQAETGVGKLGEAQKDFPYTLDTLPVKESPMMRTTGLDFFKDGRMAVCTLHGDVWIVSGVDAGLKKVVWTRFASGLFQPLGLKVVDDFVYVLGRDQITKLVDLAGSGEADFYQNFNNDTQVSENFHEFAMDLQADAEGNFYYAKAGPVVPGGQGFEKVLAHHGCFLKVSKDGSKLEVVATGLRAANGISVGPNGELTSADNEGTWTPSSRINFIKPGGFYGCPPVSHREPAPTTYDPPLCWIPHDKVDNSSGGQVWVNTNNRWGPLEGRLLHMSYGMSALFLVLAEQVNGVWQGGVVKMPLVFRTGIMRGRFNPHDGQLYVCGVRGWQTTGAKWGAVQRVRFTGGAFNLPVNIAVQRDGVALTFLNELDKNSADTDNFDVSQWNYRWSANYGSPHFSVTTPNKQGEDKVEVTDAKLSADKKTIKLTIPGIRPVMQMKIQYQIKMADGVKLKQQEAFNTINVVK